MRKQLIAIVLVMACFLTGCLQMGHDTDRYIGDDPALFTVAVHCVLGVYIRQSTQTLLLETDTYGRKLFASISQAAVSEAYEKRTLALLILQKETEDQVFYLEDVNTIVTEVSYELAFDEKTVLAQFSEEAISQMKAENHWEKALEGTFAAKNITRKVEDPFPQEIRKKAFNLLSNYYHASMDILFSTDSVGNAIYFLREYNRDALDGSKYGKSYLMFVNKDGKVVGVEEVIDLWNYREQMIAFKAANGWVISNG